MARLAKVNPLRTIDLVFRRQSRAFAAAAVFLGAFSGALAPAVAQSSTGTNVFPESREPMARRVARNGPVGETVEELVALVDARPILLGELDIDARLHRARALGADRLFGPVEKMELAAAQERLIDLLVVHAEADRLQVFEVPVSEVDRAFGELRERLDPELMERFLRDFDLRDEDLLLLLRRELRAARYLEGRFRLASRPRDQEVQDAVERERAEGRTASPEAVRAALARDRFVVLTRDFVRDLRRRSRVRIVRDVLAGITDSGLWGTVSAAEAGSSAESGAGR